MEKLDFQKNRRILSIYTKLMDGQLVKKFDMAAQFQVTEKSIQRDIDTIRDYLDFQAAEQGVRNYLIYDYKEKAYRLETPNKFHLTNSEIFAISKILLSSRAFTKEEMLDILDRLVAGCVPKGNQKLVNELLSNEKFHYVELRHHKSFLDKLWTLGQAITEKRIIEIRYKKLGERGIVDRKIEPLAILFSEYYFYLVGFIENIDKEKCFQNPEDTFPTIYRVDRIEELNVLKEHFQIPYANRFEEGEFRKRIQFMQGGKLQKIKFTCNSDTIEAVLDRLPTAQVLSENDGIYTVQAEVFGKGIDMWLKSQGERIKLV